MPFQELVTQLVTIDTHFFTFLGYSLSPIECFGTVFNLASVALMVRQNIWTWPIGLVGAVLFAFIFFQIHLYAEFFQQIYYFLSSLYGWWYWTKTQREIREIPKNIFSPYSQMLAWLILSALCTLGLTFLMTHIHTWAPQIFPEPASYPFVDSLATTLSLVAMILMAKLRTEGWIYWIVVNSISIWLYMIKGVPFICLLYGVFLLMAFVGLRRWTYASNHVGALAS
jgi:nicotinamide mononucleotide transporter